MWWLLYNNIWGSHSSVAEDSCLLGCDAVLLGEWFLIFWRTVSTFPSSSRNRQSKLGQACPVKMKVLWSFKVSSLDIWCKKIRLLCCLKMSGTNHLVTHCHILEEQNPHLTCCRSQTVENFYIQSTFYSHVTSSHWWNRQSAGRGNKNVD